MSFTIEGINTIPELDPYHVDTGGITYTELRISPESNSVCVSQQCRTNSMTMDAYNGIELRYKMDGHPRADDVRDWLEGDGREEIETIIEGHEIEWNGHNMVGSMTREAAAANDSIAYFLLDAPFDDFYSIWSVSDWCATYGEMTDKELAALQDKEGIILV